MKKASPREPSAAAVAEMPEIDFSAYRVRRNPFAARIAREGIEIVHDEPTPQSLAEMPEPNFAVARVRRNPYASRAAEVVAKIQYGKGRPRGGDEVGATPARSLRLPIAAWQALEAEAREKHTTVHALLRELVVTHLEQEVERKRRRRR